MQKTARPKLPVSPFIDLTGRLETGDNGEPCDNFGSFGLTFFATPFSLGSFFFLLSCGLFAFVCFVNWPELFLRAFRGGFSSRAGSPFLEGDCFVGRPVTRGDWILVELHGIINSVF